MKIFARLDDANKVINIECVSDENASTEQDGQDFLIELHHGVKKGRGSQYYRYWKQSFKDGTRKNSAGMGGEYDSTRDAFIFIKPYPSWELDEDTCRWKAPVAKPDDATVVSQWNEDTQSWDDITLTA